MRVLVLSPHPDDAEIGCGGALYDWVVNGARIDIAVFTGYGDLTMQHNGNVVKFEERITEQANAAKVLGCNVQHLNLAPAANFDTVPMVRFVSALDKLVPHYDVVITPLPSHAKDHVVVWEACIAAFRQGRADYVRLYAYEQPMQHFGGMVPEYGKVYVPLSQEAVFKKTQAIDCHKSQFADRKPGLCSPDSICSLAALRGAECGTEFAELFYLVRGRYEGFI